MKSITRFLRLFILLLMIGMASILPVPILFYGKDSLPKNLTEMVEKAEDVEEEDDIKALF
ncbi:MAG: hypothetical protein KC469_07865 [Flavobacteriaceae bacterium]|nr:hypothetical protein [Flavobacteriaceae bacterium]